LAREIIFELKGRMPHQIPLARMAAYMQEFAALIGTDDAALFSEIRQGSTRIAAMPREAGGQSSIRRRILNASKGVGPREAVAAFRKITELANADRAPAKVTDGHTAIVHFPSNLPAYDPIRVIERGHITGVLEGVLRDGHKGVKARIRPDGGPMVICTASTAVGKNVGGLFLEYVRAYGSGHWRRESTGKWVCESFSIDSIERVSGVSLREAISDLRTLDLTWSDDGWEDFDEVASQA
jgi:hypothetical protein